MDKHHIDQLLDRYLSGNCTAKEQLRIEQWLDKTEHSSGEWFDFTEDDKAIYISNIKARLQENIRNTGRTVVPPNKRKTFVYLAAACVALMVCTLVVIFYNRPGSFKYNSRVTANRDIAPGENTATLTLSNGRKMILSNVADGQFANEAEVSISKTADGQLVYTPHHSDTETNSAQTAGENSGHENLNKLETANGQQYIVNLPDGSKVWLNAASSLKFPSSFSSFKERKVELIGEAYFVVKHNAKQPFRVETKGQIVEDIGTKFNINAYTDEGITKTTLIEGAARVVALNPLAVTLNLSKHALRQAQGDMGQSQHDNSVVLKPNQQSMLTNTGVVNVIQVDAESEIAWTNGDFFFKAEPLESVMRKIARWYDVSVEFAPDLPKNIRLSGHISRSRTISAVLERMGRTGNIYFNIKGKKVIVTPLKQLEK